MKSKGNSRSSARDKAVAATAATVSTTVTAEVDLPASASHAAKAPESGLTSQVLATGFPIVGIGASAGGLAAFEAFFSGMPAVADPGMAFVLVQHLAPDHQSILAGLIQRYTRRHVSEVHDGMVVEVNSAYIIPP